MLSKIIEDTTDYAAVMITLKKYKRNDPRLYETIPISIWCWGLDSEEAVAIQFPKVEEPEEDNNDHWTSSIKTLTQNNPHTAVYGPIIFRVVKPITNNSVGVMYTDYK